MTSNKTKAADLIAAKKKETTPPSKEAMTELVTILKHNDSVISSQQRIGWESCCRLLAEYGWTGRYDALNEVCRNLGRSSYASR